MNDAELNALVARIESLEQQQELLLYTVTHDLRTPVMTVLGFTDLVLADWQSNTQPSQSRQYLERIRGAAYRQSRMIQELQKIANLRREPLQSQLVDLSSIAREQMNSLASSESSVIVNINPTPNVHCDTETMKLALNALLSNALKLSDNAPTSEIEFGAETHDGLSSFYVRNNGSGFDLGADQSLLSLFRQLQSGNEFGGTGIALLTATVIIHQHGGKLWTDSDPGTGTTVHFSLPA